MYECSSVHETGFHLHVPSRLTITAHLSFWSLPEASKAHLEEAIECLPEHLVEKRKIFICFHIF